MLFEGQQIELTIEKVAAGGWTLGRHHGQVVLVRGAIPGERVTAWIEKADRSVAYANTRDVLAASPDRRVPPFDPRCGGAVFAHVAYDRQLALKAQILEDAFARLARRPLEYPPIVAASPESGYRMRARLHVRGDRAGFFREGTHELCDAAATRQLLPETLDAATAVVRALHGTSPDSVTAIAIAENIAGDERAAHVELSNGAQVDEAMFAHAAEAAGVRGISARTAAGTARSVRDPTVTDTLSAISGDRALEGDIRRHAESFFQGNRHLLPALVSAVTAAVPKGSHVVDLYAGVGLFSVVLAAAGHPEITAVEGDRSSARDLRHNARPFARRLRVKAASVEAYLSSATPAIETLLVDPPRTGISKLAMEGVLRRTPANIVYVSCDPATLARDARRLLDAGYEMKSIRAFDLFPDTAHVEALVAFSRVSAQSRPSCLPSGRRRETQRR